MNPPISLSAVEKACEPTFLQLPWVRISGPDEEVTGLVDVTADEDGVALYYGDEGQDHAEFLWMASRAMPAMVEALRALLELHQPEPWSTKSVTVCAHCSARQAVATVWPCPTVRAIRNAGIDTGEAGTS